MHFVAAKERMSSTGVASQFHASMDLLDHLREIGHNAADKWLKANGSSINETSSFDFKQFLG